MTTDAPEDDDAPFAPGEDWIDAFKRECTHKLRLDMKEYARWRGRGVRRAGGNIDDCYAEDVVSGVLADTLSGVVVWQPKRKTLHQHVQDTIRSRTRHDRKRANRFKHDRIDAPTTTIDKQATRGLVEASLVQDHGDDSVQHAIYAREVMQQLRDLAAGDHHVVAYLDGIVAGARTAEEIMEHTEMSTRTFRNARDRLARLVERHDSESVERGVRA
jgi:hypothetical protein